MPVDSASCPRVSGERSYPASVACTMPSIGVGCPSYCGALVQPTSASGEQTALTNSVI